MFPARYFNPRFWAARYWAKIGAEANALNILDGQVLSLNSVHYLTSLNGEKTVLSLSGVKTTEEIP